MQFLSVEAHAFRNLLDIAIEPDPCANLIFGDNAQGKTNFLEALCLLAGQGAFRAARTSELLCFGAEQARLFANVRVRGLTREVQVDLSASGRKQRIDGKRPTAEHTGLSAVLFCPEDLLLPRGSPAGRRQLLDAAMLAVWPQYVGLQRDYAKTLGSRNRVLKQATAARQLEELLTTYDQQLALLGGRIVAARERYVRRLQPEFAASFGAICRTLPAAVSYRAQTPGDDPKAVAAVLLALLQQRRAEDLARKVTTCGPHTDDLEFTIDGRSARAFGSQGQVRSLVLAFRAAQIIDAKRVLGEYPVLLLDDVSSELDPLRNDYLFDFVRQLQCQFFVTTTRPELIPLTARQRAFRCTQGQLVRA